MILLKNVSNPKNPTDELSHNNSKNIPPDELFVRKFRILPVISILLKDSNSIFRPEAINSELIKAHTLSLR